MPKAAAGLPDSAFDETKLGKAAPVMPVLVVQAVHDNIISVEDIDELVATYTRGGTAVTYHRDRFCDHLLPHPLPAPMTLRWLRNRFAGCPLEAHRTIRRGKKDPFEQTRCASQYEPRRGSLSQCGHKQSFKLLRQGDSNFEGPSSPKHLSTH